MMHTWAGPLRGPPFPLPARSGAAQLRGDRCSTTSVRRRRGLLAPSAVVDPAWPAAATLNSPAGRPTEASAAVTDWARRLERSRFAPGPPVLSERPRTSTLATLQDLLWAAAAR